MREACRLIKGSERLHFSACQSRLLMSSDQGRLSLWGGMRQFMQGAKTCGKNPKAHSAVCLQEPRNKKNSTRRVLVVLRIWAGVI